MKLLFDQNLSHKLGSRLADLFPGSMHVRDVGLEEAPDDAVWAHALRNGFVIVSKDSDFHQRSLVEGHPPKVVWLRLGNTTTALFEQLLRRRSQEIGDFVTDEDASFLALS